MYHTIWICSMFICFYDFYIVPENDWWRTDEFSSAKENSVYSLITLVAVMCPIVNTIIAAICILKWVWTLFMEWEW